MSTAIQPFQRFCIAEDIARGHSQGWTAKRYEIAQTTVWAWLQSDDEFRDLVRRIQYEMFAANGAMLLAGIHAAQRLLLEFHLGEIEETPQVISARAYLDGTIHKLFNDPESARAFLDGAIQSASQAAIAAGKPTPS